MVSREHFKAVVNVILRLPALFILDDLFRPRLPDTISRRLTLIMCFKNTGTSEKFAALALVILLETLPLKQLVALYIHMICGGLLTFANWISQMYVNVNGEMRNADTGDNWLPIVGKYEAFKNTVVTLLVQCVIALVISCLIDLWRYLRLVTLVFTGPMIARMFGCQSHDLLIVHICSKYMCGTVVFFYTSLNIILFVVSRGIKAINRVRELIADGSVFEACIKYWNSIIVHIEKQIPAFWICLFIDRLYVSLKVISDLRQEEDSSWILLSSLGLSSAGPISMITLCATVHFFVFNICFKTISELGQKHIHRYNELINWFDHLQETVYCIDFTDPTVHYFLTCITFSLPLLKKTAVDMIRRGMILMLCFVFLLSTIMPFLFELLKILLVLSTTKPNKCLWKNFFATLTCTFFLVSFLYMAACIPQVFGTNLYLSVFLLEMCLKCSLALFEGIFFYLLLTYDAMRVTPWEKVDDLMFYTRSTVQILKFFLLVYVTCFDKKFTFGPWNLWSYQDFNFISVIYLLVFIKLIYDVYTFYHIRKILKEVEYLRECSKDEIDSYSDICAICLEAMCSALVTRCGHFFHGRCLKKCLYVKDSCPMCKRPITGTTPESRDQGERTPAVHVDNITEDEEYFDAVAQQ